jgi:hypothetical protein
VTPDERRLAETWPDGTFGGAREPRTEPAPAPRRPTTALEAAEHRRALEAALDEIEGNAAARRRHLRAVPPAA